MLSGGPWAHHFQKKCALGTVFFHHVYGIVPGLIFNGVWVLAGASRRGKSIEIHATVIKNQGSQELRQRWLLDAARVDFLLILEPFWEALALRFSFVGVLERGSKFHDFPVLSRSLSRAVLEADNKVSGALQPSLLKHSKLQNTNCTSIDEELSLIHI